MLKRKYRTVVAAVLAGAALCSPLSCGMTCLEGSGVRPDVATEAVAPVAGEFVREFVESGVVGCVLSHAVLDINWSDWTVAVQVGPWVWVGAEAVRQVGAIGQRGNELVWMVRP